MTVRKPQPLTAILKRPSSCSSLSIFFDGIGNFLILALTTENNTETQDPINFIKGAFMRSILGFMIFVSAINARAFTVGQKQAGKAVGVTTTITFSADDCKNLVRHDGYLGYSCDLPVKTEGITYESTNFMVGSNYAINVSAVNGSWVRVTVGKIPYGDITLDEATAAMKLFTTTNSQFTFTNLVLK